MNLFKQIAQAFRDLRKTEKRKSKHKVNREYSGDQKRAWNKISKGVTVILLTGRFKGDTVRMSKSLAMVKFQTNKAVPTAETKDLFDIAGITV